MARSGCRWEKRWTWSFILWWRVEIVHDWRSKTSIEELKRKVEERGYSAITVSDGHPSFGHAALKQFPFQLTSEHCKPISTCCKHPCKIYIYTPPEHLRKP